MSLSLELIVISKSYSEDMVRNDHLPGGPVIAYIIVFYINATKIDSGRPV